jgi:hypothetical protein
VEHTPGPWSVNTDPMYDSGRPFIVWGPKGPGYGLVAHVAPWCPPTKQSQPELFEKCEANARLIAAAPDMYEALREELEILCAWKITAKVPDGLREDIDISIENIRNVLAKAEGK